MAIREITSKSLLIKRKKIDSWFISSYGMNLYRGCSHNCAYCDGRAEKYQVEGTFGDDVAVKINAPELLKTELNPTRKRTPMKRNFIVLGGGVGDSYQPIEEKYQLCRQILPIIRDSGFPVHVLTKSTLVLRDIDLLMQINQKSRVLVSFSFSCADDTIGKIFEPGVPLPSQRLEAISLLKSKGIPCGMFLMPVLPDITDSPGALEHTLTKGKEAGIDYVVFGGLTLKDGKQKDYFFDLLDKTYPGLSTRYSHIFPGSKWGSATDDYYHGLQLAFNAVAKKLKIPTRIPYTFFKDILDPEELVVVLLEQIHYFLQLSNGASPFENSPFGYSAYSISNLKEPLVNYKTDLLKIKGMNKHVEKVILEIIDTGRSTYYETLLNWG